MIMQSTPGTLLTVTVSCSHMITICELRNQFPTSRVNEEASSKTTIRGPIAVANLLSNQSETEVISLFMII